MMKILNTTRSWSQSSAFADCLAEEDLVGLSFRAHRRRPSISPSERNNILQRAGNSLRSVQYALNGHETERDWITQLLDYVQHLQTLPPAQTPEEQFGQLYYLRKWLFWVPVALLQRSEGQGPAMLAIAHFYATALALEPLYPDLGPSFCSVMALPPLEAIVQVTDSMQSEQTMNTGPMEVVGLMQFPKQMSLHYRARSFQETQQVNSPQGDSYTNMNQGNLGRTSTGNLSPAFVPPNLYGSASQSSASHASYLEVPTAQQGFSYGVQGGWGIPSPGLPAQSYQTQDEQTYGYMGSYSSGGFVPAPIWT
jgi:hypothetical protein